MRITAHSFRRTTLLMAAMGTGILVTSLLLVAPASAAVQTFPTFGAFNGVACSSNTQCLGVGTGGTAPLNTANGALSAGQSIQPIAGTEFLTSVSCPSATQCLAVGENTGETEGAAVALNPATGAISSGQSVQTVPGIFFTGVACPSDTQCLAVGHGPTGAGLAVPLNPSTGAISSGQNVQTITAGVGDLGWQGVACPSISQCVAVGINAAQSAGAAVPLNPATGAISSGQSVQNVTTKGVLFAVSCPSATDCLAVGWGASEPSIAVPLDPATGTVLAGQSDQTISARAAMLSAVSCSSPSQCLAVGNDTGDPSNGQAVPLNPVTGTISSGQSIEYVAGTGSLNATTCPSATQCLAAGYAFGASGGVTVVLDPATGLLVGTSSPTTTTTTTAVTSTAVTSPGTSGLAYTGFDARPLLVTGGVLIAGGLVLLGLTHPRRRKRSTSTS